MSQRCQTVRITRVSGLTLIDGNAREITREYAELATGRGLAHQSKKLRDVSRRPAYPLRDYREQPGCALGSLP